MNEIFTNIQMKLKEELDENAMNTPSVSCIRQQALPCATV